jgi:hypothetical protein
MAAFAACLALGFALLAPGAAAAATQPQQPASGPGGSDYAHVDWRVSSGGTGPDAWYAFEPVAPTPASAPLAVVMHGYYEYAGFASMHELIRHTVRQGNVVIFPRWQTDIATPCPGPINIEPCITSAVNGINGALAHLQSSPGNVQPELQRTSYLGFSFGGIITANLANRWASLGLPEPRAIFLEDPHDGGLAGLGEPAVDDSLAGIPASVKLQCHSSAEGVTGEPGNQNESCNSIFPKLGHIPPANKDLVMALTDAHGDPGLASGHGVCATPPGAADAYDWGFCWKVWDALRNLAYHGTDCRFAMGDSPEHRSNGRWSDGVPIAPLKIQDSAPISPTSARDGAIGGCGKPTLKLRAKKAQGLERLRVSVTLDAGATAIARARVRLPDGKALRFKRTRGEAQAGERLTLRLRPGKSRRALRRALARGERLRAKVKVTARNVEGATTAKRSIALR